MLHQLTPSIYLAEIEGQYSYTTRWGNIRDAYALIGKICTSFFNHGLDREYLKQTAFTDLFVAMHDYDGKREVGLFASFHIYKSARETARLFGSMEYGQPFALMKSPRQFYLYHYPRYVPESLLNCSMEFLANKHKQPYQYANASKFWSAAEKIALSMTGKMPRNWEIIKARCSGVTCVVLGKEHNVIPSTITQTMKNNCGRIADRWNYQEAKALLF